MVQNAPKKIVIMFAVSISPPQFYAFNHRTFRSGAIYCAINRAATILCGVSACFAEAQGMALSQRRAIKRGGKSAPDSA